MRLSFAAASAAALALLTGAPGGVSAGTGEDANNVAIGVGVICNTSEQMLRLVSLRVDGDDVGHAVTVVNGEAKDPRACGVAAVAFTSDKMVDMKNVQGKLVQIVRISVLATFDGARWARVPAMTQYALIEPEGYAI